MGFKLSRWGWGGGEWAPGKARVTKESGTFRDACETPQTVAEKGTRRSNRRGNDQRRRRWGQAGEFSGAKTPCFPCRAPEFHPWSGECTPMAQRRVPMMRLQIPCTATEFKEPSATAKARGSQVNKHSFNKVSAQDLSSDCKSS